MGNVLFEFLDRMSIENVITCLHYRFDKVIFFGYQEIIEREKEKTERFLKKYCGVKKAVYHAASHDNLESIVSSMSKEIEYELAEHNKLFFDLTGGEDLVLVAFGVLTKKYSTPMHKYDIQKDKLIDLSEDRARCLSAVVEEQNIDMTLDMYIELQGGKINHDMQKSVKSDSNEDFRNDTARIWQVAKRNLEYWNPFSEFMRNHMEPDSNLQVSVSKSTILDALAHSKSKLKSKDKFEQMIKKLAAIKVLLDVDMSQNTYQFRFKNGKIKECIWDGGSILELHTFQTEKLVSDECLVGVHIDWDGIIHENAGNDVLNEIDVLSRKGNVVTFVSCKTGRMGSEQALHALYELQTVAKRFGDKYSKKVLVTARPLGDVYMERAEEMDIEVRSAE